MPYKAALLLFGVIVLFQMRNVKFPKELAEFNEIKHMSFNLYNWFFAMTILVPLLSSEKNPSARYAMKNLGLLWCCLVTLFVFFLPKFKMINSGVVSTFMPVTTVNVPAYCICVNDEKRKMKRIVK